MGAYSRGRLIRGGVYKIIVEYKIIIEINKTLLKTSFILVGISS